VSNNNIDKITITATCTILVTTLLLLSPILYPVVSLAELITGTNGNDNLVGTDSDDEISGLDGNDRISGMGSADNIDTGNGNNQIYGGDEMIR
jgi:Ca2+-binding RTX toxin-like protein